MIFEVSDKILNERIAKALNVDVSIVESMDKDTRKAKVKELFEDYVLDENDSITGQAFYKFY